MEDPVVRLKRLKMAAHRAVQLLICSPAYIVYIQLLLLSAAIDISVGPENRFSSLIPISTLSSMYYVVLYRNVRFNPHL